MSKCFSWLAIFVSLIITLPGCATDGSNDGTSPTNDANNTEEPEQYGSGPRE